MLTSKYAKRDTMESEFSQRANLIPAHGLGLSVDVYTPDLMELVRSLREEGLQPGYLEIFKATTSALRWVRRRLPELKLTYHGEGLWLTQPHFARSFSGQHGVAEACIQVGTLESAWLNHECASKQIGGYAFGTYLPPLYTELSARITADNLEYVQGRVDAWGQRAGRAPALVLLEMPPLTYFACGSSGIPDFFRAVTERVACGLVLDIGHLWTVYRYTGVWRSQALQDFVAGFLDAFPMERVIEIHVAGLAPLARHPGSEHDALLPGLPYWIDSHGSPIPEVLFDLLVQVLAHPRLTALKGVALEVDTKPVTEIVTEFRRFSDRFESKVRYSGQAGRVEFLQGGARQALPASAQNASVASDEMATLVRQYEDYVALVTSDRRPVPAGLSLLGGSIEDLDRYRQTYVPQELLHWGGELTDMFPRTCQLITAANLPVERFTAFWFSTPRPEEEDYDFFLLKVDRFVEFVADGCPSAAATAMEESVELRAAYRTANEPVESEEVRG